jgi:hypothetical protein
MSTGRGERRMSAMVIPGGRERLQMIATPPRRRTSGSTRSHRKGGDLPFTACLSCREPTCQSIELCHGQRFSPPLRRDARIAQQRLATYMLQRAA